MKAKSRKRLLISSVAMLLVAMLALGTATFAWFTTNPNANASGIKLKTTAAAGLEVRTDSDNAWSHNASLYKNQAANATFDLTPVSHDQSAPAKFYTVEAADPDAFAAKAAAMTEVTEIGGYLSGTLATTGALYAEKIYFKLSDGANETDNASKEVKLTGVTITAAQGTNNLYQAVRVAIVQGSTILGTYAPDNTTANGTIKPDADNDDKPTAAIPFSPALTNAATGLNVATGLTGLSTAGDSLTKFVTVYVYLDGQDTNCKTTMVTAADAAELISSVKVDFTLA